MDVGVGVDYMYFVFHVHCLMHRPLQSPWCIHSTIPVPWEEY